MTIDNTDIEQALKTMLQRKIKINLKNKQIKKGKLILFKQANYHLELTIKRDDGDLKRFEIPIPFKVENHPSEGLIYFDYRFSTLGRGNEELLGILKVLPKEGNSKFYNQILEIEVLK